MWIIRIERQSRRERRKNQRVARWLFFHQVTFCGCQALLERILNVSRRLINLYINTFELLIILIIVTFINILHGYIIAQRNCQNLIDYSSVRLNCSIRLFEGEANLVQVCILGLFILWVCFSLFAEPTRKRRGVVYCNFTQCDFALIDW